MIREVILSALVSSATFVSAAGLSSGSVTDGSGVNIHFTDAKPGELEMLAAAGFKHVRMDLTWGSTEKQKGVYDFSAYDRLTASLEKHGLKGYYILDYANSLYEKERSVRTPEGRAAYAKWAAAVVGHFKGRGICWEIWNEPNGGFWAPRANVDEYVAMAMDASKAIRAVDPDAILTGPATATIDMPFLEGCFKAGLLEYWDAVTVHPYRQGGPESATFEYDALRRLIAKYQPKNKPVKILSGEWGYSSAWANHDEESQGKMLPRQFLTNAANGVPMSIWYDWHDDGPDPKEPEHHFGTVRLQYHEGRDPVYDPKPAYTAAKTFHEVLRGAAFVKSVTLGNLDHHAQLYRHENGDLTVAAWAVLGRSEIAVKLPSDDGTFKVVDHLGEALPEVTAKGGNVSLKITDAPRYFRFKGPNQKLTAAPEAMLVRMAVAPVVGKEILVKVENLSRKAFKAKITLRGNAELKAETTTREIEVPAEPGVTDAAFPLTETPAAGYEASATMEVGGAVISEIASRRFSAPDPAVLDGARLGIEGDPQVGGTFTLSKAEAPESFPGGKETVMKLDYDFQPGWKYLPVYPSDKGRKLEGRKDDEQSRAIFGAWIYGDGSHITARLRVKDAVGRTWQPSGPEITWKGWKYVEMRLDESTASWGGPENGKTQGPKFPLSWDAVLLFDNTKRLEAKGTIHFTMPVMILE
jgi:hypothetical protein